MTERTGCCRGEGASAPDSHCDNCDVLVGLDGVHVVDVDTDGGRLTVTVESASVQRVARGGLRVGGLSSLDPSSGGGSACRRESGRPGADQPDGRSATRRTGAGEV